MLRESTYCPTCSAELRTSESYCGSCGTEPLSLKTVRVEDVFSEEAIYKNIQRTPLPPQHILVLYMVGRPSPLVLEARSEMVLGRHVPGDRTRNIVDMAAFHGGAMGVSRRHAIIYHEHGMFRLEDLGSTNGTWVNTQRLANGEPIRLHSGDRVQIGRMVFFVHFAD